MDFGKNDKTTEVILGGEKAFVMTLRKGNAAEVKQDGDTVVIGGRRVALDGTKLVLSGVR